MIFNATILRIDTRGEYDVATADRPTVEGPAMALRCSWQRPRSGQKWVPGATISDASAVLYVDGNQTGAIVPESRVLLQVDGEAGTRLYRVLAVEPLIGLGMDHTEVYLDQ